MSAHLKRVVRQFSVLVSLGLVLCLVFVFLSYAVEYYGGQQKFESLCASQGGARVFQRLEKNLGWTVDEAYDGRHHEEFRRPFSFGHIAFVRVPDKKEVWFDAVPDPERPGKFLMTPADPARSVRYRYRYKRLNFPDDERFGGSRENIIDLATGKSVASFTIIYYQWAKPENTILHAPTSQSCRREPGSFDRFYRALYTGPGVQ